MSFQNDTYYCHFCKEACKGNSYSSNTSTISWWICKPCNAYYLVDFLGKLRRMTLDTTYRHQEYSLQFMYDEEETRIVSFPENPEDTLMEVANFPFLIQGVNPQNLLQKLATYLIFS